MSSPDEESPFEAREAEMNPPGSRSRCQFCPQIEALSDRRFREFWVAMDNRDIHNYTIIDVLSDWGLTVSETALSTHRSFRRRPNCVPRIAAMRERLREITQ